MTRAVSQKTMSTIGSFTRLSASCPQSEWKNIDCSHCLHHPSQMKREKPLFVPTCSEPKPARLWQKSPQLFCSESHVARCRTMSTCPCAGQSLHVALGAAQLQHSCRSINVWRSGSSSIPRVRTHCIASELGSSGARCKARGDYGRCVRFPLGASRPPGQQS